MSMNMPMEIIRPLGEATEEEIRRELKQYVPSRLVQRVLSNQPKQAKRSAWRAIQALQRLYEQQGKADRAFLFPFQALSDTGLDKDTLTIIVQRLESCWIIELTCYFKIPDPSKKQPFLWHPAEISNPYEFAGQRPLLRIRNQKAFEALYVKLRAEFQPKPEIYYDKVTGVGYASGKRFWFLKRLDAYKVFPLLYEQMGESIGPDVIRRALQHEGTGFGLRVKETAKHMRRQTGLGLDHIVLNDRHLTLVGTRLEKPPS